MIYSNLAILHLWVELKHFSFLLPDPSRIGDYEFWAVLWGEWVRVSPGKCRSFNVLGISRREKSIEVKPVLKRNLVWGWTTASLEDTMRLINQIILQTEITYFSNCFDLALLGEHEGNFKEKNSLIQWILNSSSANWELAEFVLLIVFMNVLC